MKMRLCFSNIMILLSAFHTYLISEEIRTITPQVFFQEREDDPNYIFSQPRYFEFDKDLNLYILDSKDQIIKKYDKNGTFLTSFGKKGNGPCEFGSLINTQILSDKIVVFDQQRIHFFTLDGKCIETKKYSTFGGMQPILLQPSGNLLIFKIDYKERKFVFGLWDYDDKIVSEIGFFFAPNRIFSYGGGGMASIFERYYYDINKSGEIFYAFSEKYEIYKLSNDDSKLFIKEIENPIPIPEEERNKMRESSRGRITRNGKTIEEPEFEPPYFNSIVNSVIIDEKDNIWVISNSKEFKGYTCYSINGKRIARYVINDKNVNGGWPTKIQNGFLYFMRYDDNTGLKIYRAKLFK